MKYLFLGLCLSGCLQRQGEFFQQKLTFTGYNYLLAAIHSNSGQGKLVCFLTDMDALSLSEVSQAETGDTPMAIATSPNKEFVYIANSASNSISIYDLERKSCALSPIGSQTGLTQATALATNLSYLKLFVGYSSGIQAYTFNTDGTLTVDGAVKSLSGGIKNLVHSPDYNILIVHRDNGTLESYVVSQSGLSLATTTSSFTTISSLAIGTNNNTQTTYVFVADLGANLVRTFSLNSTTGVLTFVASTSVSNPISVTFYDPSPNTLFVQTQSGSVRSYYQNNDGTLTLYDTNAEVTDSMLSPATVDNNNRQLFSVGTNGGIYSWLTINMDTSMMVKTRRSKSITGYGDQVNALKGIVYE